MFNIPSYKVNVNQNDIKISPHSSQIGYHQEHKQIVARKVGKRNPYTMLVGM
jgi:hypothetical protein